MYHPGIIIKIQDHFSLVSFEKACPAHEPCPPRLLIKYLRTRQVSALSYGNRFTGNGNRGINVITGYVGIYNDNALILGNNFSNATFSYASIFLGVWSRLCTVIGSGENDHVIDKGREKNNVITGVNVVEFPHPLGQTIDDNLEVMKKAMKDMDLN